MLCKVSNERNEITRSPSLFDNRLLGHNRSLIANQIAAATLQLPHTLLPIQSSLFGGVEKELHSLHELHMGCLSTESVPVVVILLLQIVMEEDCILDRRPLFFPLREDIVHNRLRVTAMCGCYPEHVVFDSLLVFIHYG